MQPVGAVHIIPAGQVSRQIFEAEVQLVHSLDEARKKMRFSLRNARSPLGRDSAPSPEGRLLPCCQQQAVEGTPYNNSTAKPLLYREATTFQKAWRSADVTAAEEVRGLPDSVAGEEARSSSLGSLRERRRGAQHRALSSMHHELACIGQEMEPLVLEPGKLFLTKLMESDRKMELLFKELEAGATQEGFPVERLEELWNIIQQESFSRKKWVRELDASLRKVEWSRADQITEVLRKYAVRLEEISFFLPPDVHRLMNDEAMMINRALLANQRAIAKLFFTLMKSVLGWELAHQWRWQGTLQDWKLTQKNCVVHHFREFMAKEEMKNPPSVQTEMEEMLMGQILLGYRRLELLQHLSDLLPPTHTKAELEEWYSSLVNFNQSIDTHNEQWMLRLHLQHQMVLQQCLAEVQSCKNNLVSLKVCTEEEAEEMVNSELLQLPERLKSQFEEELEQMEQDFEELARETEQKCRDLYSYAQEALALWAGHQLRLAQQQAELQKTLDECREKQEKVRQKMEANLEKTLANMRRASSEKKLKKYLQSALSSLDAIRARHEAFHEVLLGQVMPYPEAVWQELFSYSKSISQCFHVKEIFQQNLQGEVDFTFQEAEVVKSPEAECVLEQQAESILQGKGGEGEKTDSCEQDIEETNTAEEEEIFVQGTEETEGKEEEESIPCGSEDTEQAGQGAKSESSKAESSASAIQIFFTSSGNFYTALGGGEAGKAGMAGAYSTKHGQEPLPEYLKYILIKETVFGMLKKWIRLCFFEHLEKWFAESLATSRLFVAAKKEELDSELQLSLCELQQRQENIEAEIYKARAEELLLHKEQLECHCAGLVEALKQQRAEFLKLCDQQDDIRKSLESRIQDMESVLLTAPMSEKLLSFGKSVPSELQDHLEVIQLSLRSYQQSLKEALGKLRDSNVDFLQACSLFLEGGNFSPEEVKSASKRLQEQRKQIDSFEKSVKKEVEKVASHCLEQVCRASLLEMMDDIGILEATELINQAETKLHCIFVSRVFVRKTQRFLSSLQVQFRAEVAKSNLQAVTLNSYLEKLHQKTDACACSTADKALTAEELYDFTKVVLKALKKRSQYLDCLLVKAVTPHDSEDFPPLVRDVLLQGPIAAAIRAECLREESQGLLLGLQPDQFPLLNPSRMGKSALDDLSIQLIRNLLEIQPSGASPDRNQKRKDHSQTDPQSSAPDGKAPQTTKKSPGKKKMLRRRKQKDPESVLSDKRYQIFGEKPPGSDTFKGNIINLLWTGNNSLLCLAEEFYQTQKPQIPMPEDLPGTFECWAEMLKQKLLSYHSQTNDHYNSFLRDFQDQVKLFEKELPCVCQLAIDSLLEEHEQKLSNCTGQIQQLFSNQLEEWENAKAVHKKQLHPSLGHPDNLVQLDALCQEELQRQQEQAEGIHLHTEKLQECAAECAQDFFSALAAFTEKLLLELDESITAEEVQAAKTAIPREKTSPPIHPNQTGPPPEMGEVKQLMERGSRTWPGIPMTTLADNSDYVLCRETASVTTAKSTLGHTAAVGARDAAYEKYKCQLEQQFAQVKAESTAQLLALQQWEDWWEQSIQKIKQLYP